jgi:putative membrane protein
MTRRLTLVSFTLALAAVTEGCLLRPIDPNPPSARVAREPEPEPAPQQPEPAVTPPAVTPPVAAPPPVTEPVVTPPVSAPPVTPPVTPPVVAPPVSAPPAVVTPVPAPVQAPFTPSMPISVPRRSDLKDSHVAALLLASNNTDISYARLVPSRAQRDDVRKFAERMLTDHTGVNGLVTDLLRKLDLAPEENGMSLDMRDESANKRDIMRELSGFTFDSTYMENEVAYHQKFLATLDNVMLPSARNGELRNLLSTVRPAVAAHLAHAEQTRANVLAKK